jgi:hypothetical protein
VGHYPRRPDVLVHGLVQRTGQLRHPAHIAPGGALDCHWSYDLEGFKNSQLPGLHQLSRPGSCRSVGRSGESGVSGPRGTDANGSVDRRVRAPLSSRSETKLRAAWVTQPSRGCLITPSRCTTRLSTSITKSILWNLICQAPSVRRLGKNRTFGTAVGMADIPISRGVGPAGLAVSLSRATSAWSADWPSSTAARSSSVSGMAMSIR